MCYFDLNFPFTIVRILILGDPSWQIGGFLRVWLDPSLQLPARQSPGRIRRRAMGERSCNHPQES